MPNSLSHYISLARRWAWMVILGIILCGGATYAISMDIPPVYQASTILIINLGSSTSSYDNVNASLLAATSYAPLLTNPEVLKPILAQHPELTLQQLSAMITVKTQSNTSLIELDVDNSDPALAAELANEVGQSFAFYVQTHLFASYTKTQLLETVQVVPAAIPTDPIRPKPLMYAGIGSLVGLGLALSLIVIFEWMDDRLARLEEVQELLGIETLAVFPKLSRRQRKRKIEENPALAEKCRMLCASMNAAQAVKPFKLVLITSAQPGEGKSTVAANLAFFLAMTGKRVLLVDANLRHPTLDQHFQLNNNMGLSTTLLGITKSGDWNVGIQETDNPMLHVLTAGLPSPNPAELLQSSPANQLFDYLKKAEFDYIILDTCPLLPVADAQILASYIHATILVIDPSKTTRKALLQAKSTLGRTHRTILGAVINKSRWESEVYRDSRQYLNSIKRPKTKITIPTTPPLGVMTNTASAATIPVEEFDPLDQKIPPVDGLADPDITVALPRWKPSNEE